MQYLAEEERASCFTLIVFVVVWLLVFLCRFLTTAVYDCDISWSYAPV